jgi:hypothetical protein
MIADYDFNCVVQSSLRPCGDFEFTYGLQGAPPSHVNRHDLLLHFNSSRDTSDEIVVAWSETHSQWVGMYHTRGTFSGPYQLDGRHADKILEAYSIPRNVFLEYARDAFQKPEADTSNLIPLVIQTHPHRLEDIS